MMAQGCEVQVFRFVKRIFVISSRLDRLLAFLHHIFRHPSFPQHLEGGVYHVLAKSLLSVLRVNFILAPSHVP